MPRALPRSQGISSFLWNLYSYGQAECGEWAMWRCVFGHSKFLGCTAILAVSLPVTNNRSLFPALQMPLLWFREQTVRNIIGQYNSPTCRLYPRDAFIAHRAHPCSNFSVHNVMFYLTCAISPCGRTRIASGLPRRLDRAPPPHAPPNGTDQHDDLRVY